MAAPQATAFDPVVTTNAGWAERALRSKPNLSAREEDHFQSRLSISNLKPPALWFFGKPNKTWHGQGSLAFYNGPASIPTSSSALDS